MQNTKYAGVNPVFMVTVSDREYAEELVSLFTSEGACFNILAHARGTASSEMLDYFGLEDTEKVVMMSIMAFKRSKQLLKKLLDTRLSKPGGGISFTVPLSSVGTERTAELLKTGIQENGGEQMEKVFHHSLIIAITNRGFADDVMDAAKAVKAAGGTVIHARGAGMREAEKFFGVTIHPEKELVMILAPSDRKNIIMKSIVAQAGYQTKAHTVVFSLPVNGVAGLPEEFFDGPPAE